VPHEVQRRRGCSGTRNGSRLNLAPLWAIRLRTPRLELRLPTDDELEELFDVAAAGIHPPEEMPFAVAWTDDLRSESFLEFHRTRWREWSAENWVCNFVTFLDGRVIGTQGIEARDFARERTVETGSWLGARHQGEGYGTEQRAAVLEFAFRGLRANAATTGALFPNIASQRVSEKLGYRVVGTSELAPRGEPVRHYDYRIERAEWRCPISVEIEGLGLALALFGVS
jgi:RimJ/RimL family protein N-acetyltransferase